MRPALAARLPAQAIANGCSSPERGARRSVDPRIEVSGVVKSKNAEVPVRAPFQLVNACVAKAERPCGFDGALNQLGQDDRTRAAVRNDCGAFTGIDDVPHESRGSLPQVGIRLASGRPDSSPCDAQS